MGKPETTSGRTMGRLGRAKREQILDLLTQAIERCALRDIRIADVMPGTTGLTVATFHLYFENIGQAILVLARERTEFSERVQEVIDFVKKEAARGLIK